MLKKIFIILAIVTIYCPATLFAEVDDPTYFREIIAPYQKAFSECKEKYEKLGELGDYDPAEYNYDYDKYYEKVELQRKINDEFANICSSLKNRSYNLMDGILFSTVFMPYLKELIPQNPNDFEQTRWSWRQYGLTEEDFGEKLLLPIHDHPAIIRIKKKLMEMDINLYIEPKSHLVARYPVREMKGDFLGATLTTESGEKAVFIAEEARFFHLVHELIHVIQFEDNGWPEPYKPEDAHVSLDVASLDKHLEYIDAKLSEVEAHYVTYRLTENLDSLHFLRMEFMNAIAVYAEKAYTVLQKLKMRGLLNEERFSGNDVFTVIHHLQEAQHDSGRRQGDGFLESIFGTIVDSEALQKTFGFEFLEDNQSVAYMGYKEFVQLLLITLLMPNGDYENLKNILNEKNFPLKGFLLSNEGEEEVLWIDDQRRRGYYFRININDALTEGYFNELKRKLRFLAHVDPTNIVKPRILEVSMAQRPNREQVRSKLIFNEGTDVHMSLRIYNLTSSRAFHAVRIRWYSTNSSPHGQFDTSATFYKADMEEHEPSEIEYHNGRTYRVSVGDIIEVSLKQTISGEIKDYNYFSPSAYRVTIQLLDETSAPTDSQSFDIEIQ